jgi:hypothetical protein
MHSIIQVVLIWPLMHNLHVIPVLIAPMDFRMVWTAIKPNLFNMIRWGVRQKHIQSFHLKHVQTESTPTMAHV